MELFQEGTSSPSVWSSQQKLSETLEGNLTYSPLMVISP